MPLHILLATQRSGSGALGSLLDQNPDIGYLGELFHPDGILESDNYFAFLKNILKSNPDRGLPVSSKENFNDYIKFLTDKSEKKDLIIDIKYDSTHHFNGEWYAPSDTPFLLNFANEYNFKIIHLQRKNLLKKYLSGKLAEVNNIWHTADVDSIKVTTLKVDPSDLLSCLEYTDRQASQFDQFLLSNPNVFQLEYEEIFRTEGDIKEDALTPLAEFLCVDPIQLNGIQPVWKKQVKLALPEIIQNYEEVFAALEHTKYFWMIRD
jgi:hypothetical protein